MKKNILILFLVTGFTSFMISCKKAGGSNDTCFQNETTTRQLVNKQARVELMNGTYYLVEQGTIDTYLNPCNLDDAYKVNNLQVIVSGDVKNNSPSAVCCVNNFVLADIRK